MSNVTQTLVANTTANITPTVAPTIARVAARATTSIGEKLNPINFIHEVSIYIQANSILFSLLIGFVIIIAAWIGYVIYEEWAAVPVREKTIRIGKTNVLQELAEELKKRMRQKKRFG